MKSMLDYIKEETSINESILKNLNLSEFIYKTKNNKYRDVVIYATGSSSNAATSAYIFMEKVLKMPVYIKEPSIAMNYETNLNKDSLYIAISQGGHSSSTIELVEQFQDKKLEIFAITSDLKSPIAEVSENLIDLAMGVEEVPYVTAGYTATILVLWLLSLEFAEANKIISPEKKIGYIEEIKQTISLADEVINTTDQWFAKYREELLIKNRYVFIGYGSCYGVACEAETKFTELLHLAAHGHELEEYMHGPYLGLLEDDALFLIDSNGKLSQRMGRLRTFLDQHMTKNYLFTSDKEGRETDLAFDISINEDLAPLVLTIPFHLISYYISQEKGFDLTTSYYPDFDKITESKI